jgi:uncharacterized protein (TIGR02611 family)
MRRVLRHWKLDNIKVVRRIIVSVLGATVLLIGIALLVLPGPAFVVIPVGLAILATEYAWARRWLKRARRIASDVVSGHDRPAPRDTPRVALRLSPPQASLGPNHVARARRAFPWLGERGLVRL